MNYLVWPEGRNLYGMLRKQGKVLCYIDERRKYVPYKEEDIENYRFSVLFVGGDLYEVPEPGPKETIIVYEQQGPKPSKYDAVIEVFGEARFDYEKFSKNAKYSEKQKQRPYY